jgi:hypothetical protein
VSGVFSVLPEKFFSPLASPNREHYAALLVLFYRLWEENARGIDREYLLQRFTEYAALHRSGFSEEAEEAADENSKDIKGGALSSRPIWHTTVCLAFNAAGRGANKIRKLREGGEPLGEPVRPILGHLGLEGAAEETAEANKIESGGDDRALAGKFLRTLSSSGWLGEETLSDFRRVVNIAPWAKPFLEALAGAAEGLKTEYESHIVNVYSALCSDAAKENGQYAVLHANEETQALIDSLKVLSQSIKGYYGRLADDADVSGILHQHYDEYAGEVLDAAYKRLKTSDNLSKYRPRIQQKASELLDDEAWLAESGRRLARIRGTGADDGRRSIEAMLADIKETLRALDPLLDEIDKRNSQYAKASTERIRALLEPDTTIAGKLGLLAKAFFSGDASAADFSHKLFRLRSLAKESLYRRYRHGEAEFAAPPPADKAALEAAEKEFIARMQKRLSLRKITEWLDEKGGADKVLFPEDLVAGDEGFVRFIYAVLYADSRSNFSYRLEENQSENDSNEKFAFIEKYAVPRVSLRRKT